MVPHIQFGLPAQITLKLVEPLYGLSESGDSWFDRYTSFLERLELTYAPHDVSFYHLTEKEDFQLVLTLYVDETLPVATEAFMNLTDKIPEEFNSNPKEFPPTIIRWSHDQP